MRMNNARTIKVVTEVRVSSGKNELVLTKRELSLRDGRLTFGSPYRVKRPLK